MEKTALRDWFPEFASMISPPDADAVFDLQINWGDIKSIAAVVGLADRVQTSALLSEVDVLVVAAAFFRDIQSVRTLADDSITPALDFLQLMNATQPLVWARSGQQWQIVYDWLYYALNDKMPCPVEVEFYLIDCEGCSLDLILASRL